jgi:cytochrome c biogenesis protein CcmG/thiol:disulfide interchange protein DsbE
MKRLSVIFAALATLIAGTPVARADGDPGSDVLVYQPLFLTSGAGVSVAQQAQLDTLLRAAARAGMPVRVAIISSRSDLGAVTALWRKPRAYARFLGIELSLAYKGRLLVVMPDGFGVNWPGHPTAAAYRTLSAVHITPTGAGLASAATAAVRSLAAAQHITIPTPTASATPAPRGPSRRTIGTSAPRPNSAAGIVAILAVLMALVAGSLGLVRLLSRRRGRARPAAARASPRRLTQSARWALPAGALGLAATAAVAAVALVGGSPSARSDALATNPSLDPGTRLSGTAPAFTLSDEFGRPVSLRSFRGKVVILAFNDSECTTICPLTTSAMLDAKAMLGSAGQHVQLLGIDANPKATALADVLSYSQLHGMLGQWHFLTGSLPQLRAAWKAYSIGVDISRRLIDHTPALFVIDTHGGLAKLYVTQQSYAAVGQFGQLLAQEVASLLPDHPAVNSHLSYTKIDGVPPSRPVTLPRTDGGTIRLGPGGQPRLLLFFATWNQQSSGLAGQLAALDRYQAAAAPSKLPPLSAVDEASVEPSPAALPRFLRQLPHQLTYPIAIDRDGRLADGYGVQGEPWFVLTSPAGRILWYWQPATAGWLTARELTRHVRDALTRAPRTPATAAAGAKQLAGSPAALAALHQQASRLLGNQQALSARIRALHGYPIVINAWASWCTPCRSEFALFASASARYGRQVAFLGADTSDSTADAQTFLAQHHVSYPSYQTSTSDMRSLATIEGLPTTIFINPAGKIAYVHTGQYDAQGSLDADITSYALGG